MTKTIAEQVRRSVEKLKSTPTARKAVDVSLAAAKKLQSRRMRALELFRPFPYQDEFLFCPATEILVQGGTRSGKSTILAAAITSYATNSPMYTSMGCAVHMREPRFRDKPTGEVWIIGNQMNHSSTIYRLLFQPGAFQIVRDPKTGLWRAWRPGAIEGDDKIPESDRKPAPPFIYPSEVEIGWDKQREKKWNTAALPNGWVIKYYPSNGYPKRGDPVHRIWLDEEIDNDDDLYPELQSRLSDYSGKIWWSSWPNNSCEALLTLKDRAIADMADWQAGRVQIPDAYRMLFAGSANPVIDEKEKAKRRRGWDHSTWVMRDVGEFTTDNYLSYPTFNKDYHRADYGEQDSRDDKLAQYMRKHNYIPGKDWCCYLMLDPGTQRPGLLWVAIPPEEFWYKGNPFHVVYREFTGRENADQLARRTVQCDPQRTYQRFIMDCKAGDQTPMSFAASVMANYSRAWIEQGLRSVETGSSFQRGETNWVVRSTALRKLLEPVHPEASVPALRIVNHMCPQLIHQIMHNRRHVQKHDIQDKQASGQVKDLLDTLEYYAASSPTYAHPPAWQPPDNEAVRHFQKSDELWSQLITRPQAPRGNVVCGAP